MTQVFLNVINNAKDVLIDKDVKDKEIQIYLAKEGEFLSVRIKDNAGGIPLEIMDKIFEPYFTTKHQAQGTGIGLYMSKNIVESLGGSMEAFNETNGAVFEIKLKIAKEKP